VHVGGGDGTTLHGLEAGRSEGVGQRAEVPIDGRTDGRPVAVLDRDDDPDPAPGAQRPREVRGERRLTRERRTKQGAPGQGDVDLVGTTREGRRKSRRIADEEERVRQAATASRPSGTARGFPQGR
jgi:hypothetical protein